MKILIISQYFWPESFLINSIVLDLKSQNINVEVLTGKPNYPGGKILSGYKKYQKEVNWHYGVKIYRVPIFPRGKSSLTLLLNYISFVFSGIFFAKGLLRNSNYDLIFVYAPSPIFQVLVGIYIKKIKNIPLILNIQDLWPESIVAAGKIKNKLIIYFIRYVVCLIYQRCDLILCQSKSFVTSIKEISDNKKIIFFPNTVDRIFLSKNEISDNLLIPKSEIFSVIFAGNIGSAQSIHTLLLSALALHSNKNIKFYIYGDGREKENAVKFAKSHQLSNVYFCGRLPINEMPRIFDGASLLALTLANAPVFSLTIPNRLQAYMSRGRPIVAAINGEGADIIKRAKCGIAVDAENSISLAKAIEEIYRMPSQQRAELGNNAYLYFKENFHPDALLLRLKNIFNEVGENLKRST